MKLSYIVLYTAAGQLERLRTFYEQLGLALKHEQHDSGPVHFSAALENGSVIELYPGPVNDGRIGFEVKALDPILARFAEIGVRPGNPPDIRGPFRSVVLRDPDGRRIELMEKLPEARADEP